MERASYKSIDILVAGLMVAALLSAVTAHSLSKDADSQGATMHATGKFAVKLNPLEGYNKIEDARLAHLSIDKQFSGDLEAISQGEMLSAGTEIKASAGYVAIERVTGTLQGRRGSFTLQHNATMTRGEPYLNIIVVPDSGTGELQGLSGAMKIRVEDGQHYYDFEYTLDSAP